MDLYNGTGFSEWDSDHARNTTECSCLRCGKFIVLAGNKSTTDTVRDILTTGVKSRSNRTSTKGKKPAKLPVKPVQSQGIQDSSKQAQDIQKPAKQQQEKRDSVEQTLDTQKPAKQQKSSRQTEYKQKSVKQAQEDQNFPNQQQVQQNPSTQTQGKQKSTKQTQSKQSPTETDRSGGHMRRHVIAIPSAYKNMDDNQHGENQSISDDEDWHEPEEEGEEEETEEEDD